VRRPKRWRSFKGLKEGRRDRLEEKERKHNASEEERKESERPYFCAEQGRKGAYSSDVCTLNTKLSNSLKISKGDGNGKRLVSGLGV